MHMPKTSQPTYRPRRRSKEKVRKHAICFNAWTDRRIDEHIQNNQGARGTLTRSAVVGTALARFFKEDQSYWALLFLRLDRLTATVAAYTKRLDLLTDVVMHGIAYNFLNWPDDLSPEEKEAAARKSEIMVAKFENSLKRKLRSGGYLQGLDPEDLKSILEDDITEIMRELESQGKQDSDAPRT